MTVSIPGAEQCSPGDGDQDRAYASNNVACPCPPYLQNKSFGIAGILGATGMLERPRTYALGTGKRGPFINRF